MKRLLKRLLDETEFLSPYGVRALSREHERILTCIGTTDMDSYSALPAGRIRHADCSAATPTGAGPSGFR